MHLHRRITGVLCVIFALGGSLALAGESTALVRAHAHNDYQHRRPLLDALELGFCSVEADVYLVDGKLLVAHNREDCKLSRTLESLYLTPLQRRVKEFHGRVYPTVETFTLWIDVKVDPKTQNDRAAVDTEIAKSIGAIQAAVQPFSNILTRFSDTGVETNGVTIILTGAHPATVASPALFGLDSHSLAHGAKIDSTVIAFTESWSRLFQWRGEGEMPLQEREKLRSVVMNAHKQGMRVRLWGTLDKPAVWKELLDANVDWIGADDLSGLTQFLREAKGTPVSHDESQKPN